MKDLIFIGGPKGIGKSTIILELNKYLQLPVVNTGEIVIQSKARGLSPEKEIEKYLIEDFRGIVDTHYAGSYNGGGVFPRGLSKEALINIQKRKSIDFILLETNEETLFFRRLNHKSERYHDRKVMQLEIEYSRIYFEEYCKDLLIPGKIIDNTEINSAVLGILDFIK
jgi:adenylate kinase